MPEHVLVWFRQDLRLEDNPALAAALKTGRPLIAVYIHAPGEEADWQPGGASKWWLHHALKALDGQLRKHGSSLVFRVGASLENLQEICEMQRLPKAEITAFLTVTLDGPLTPQPIPLLAPVIKTTRSSSTILPP